eukprot:2324981-Pleurochrysis_carterae.AAC.2
MALKQMDDQLATARESREHSISAQPITADRASLESHMAGHNGDAAGDHLANRAAPVAAPGPGDDAPHVRVVELCGATVSELNNLREQLASLLAFSSAEVRRHPPDDALPETTLHQRRTASPLAHSCRFSSTSAHSALPSRSVRGSSGTTVCQITCRLSLPA